MNDIKKLRCNYAVVVTETDVKTGEPTWEYLIARCPDLSTAEATLALRALHDKPLLHPSS